VGELGKSRNGGRPTEQGLERPIVTARATEHQEVIEKAIAQRWDTDATATHYRPSRGDCGALAWLWNGHTTGTCPVTLRCKLDGLLLPAELRPAAPHLVAYDGDEAFGVEAIEASFYEVVAATLDELLSLERAHYRLLRQAAEFVLTG
jgi:hypothetical protein